MTTLADILPGLPADNAEALAAARAHVVTTLKPEDQRRVTEKTVIALLGPVDGEAFMQAVEASTLLTARIKSWFKPSEQGIDIALPISQALMAQMVADNDILQAHADALTAYAYETSTPFANLTLHELLIARGTCPVKAVTQLNGFVVIETTGAVEAHNPRLLADNPRTGERVRINNFRGVSSAGRYEAQVPGEWRGAALYVDDAYGVV